MQDLGRGWVGGGIGGRGESDTPTAMVWAAATLRKTDKGVGRGVNSNMVTTVGPLRRILARFCVEPIDTRHDVSMRVSFN